MNRTKWFRNAGYGFFYHFLNGLPGNGADARDGVEEWNRKVDSFDVKGVARQMSELGAGYLFLTVGQNSGFYCSPNAAYDRILGYGPKQSHCSGRDLVAELSDALSVYGIPLLVYSTGEPPKGDTNAKIRLNGVPPWLCETDSDSEKLLPYREKDPRMRRFLANWTEIHSEWSLRWGKKVSGWWIDGCYRKKEMFGHPDFPNFYSMANALRAGNPDSIVAFNNGWNFPPINFGGDAEDYTAGENNSPWDGIPESPVIGGAQYHILTYAGRTWGAGSLRYSAGELAGITARVLAAGGVITWDLPFRREDALLDDAYFQAFSEMRGILANDHERENVFLPALDTTDGTEAKISVNRTIPFRLTLGGKEYSFSGKTEYSIPFDGMMPESLDAPEYAIFRWKEYLRKLPLRRCVPMDRRRVFRIGDFAEAAFSPSGHGVEVEIILHDESPKGASDFFSGSLVEFFRSERGEIRQRLLRPEDSCLKTCSGEDDRSVEVSSSLLPDGWRAVLKIPFRGPEMLLEISVNVHRNGTLLQRNLFRSTTQPSLDNFYGKFLFPKPVASFAGNKTNMEVYTEEQVAEIRKMTDLRPLSEKTEIIFSTWGMIHPSEEEIAAKYPNLKAVFYAAGAVDFFARPFLNRGIRVFSAWKMNARPVAEMTFALILLGLKNWFAAARDYKSPGEYRQEKAGPGAYGETVALIGAGAISSRVAELLRSCTDLKPLVIPSHPERRTVTLEEAFRSAMVVSNHLPDRDDNVGVLNGSLFSSMRHGGVFINTGRGRQVNEKELAEVLGKRPDLTALLDVTWPEPPEADSPLYRLPNVWLSPHIAGSLNSELHRMSDCMIRECRAYLAEESLPNEISLENLSKG